MGKQAPQVGFLKYVFWCLLVTILTVSYGTSIYVIVVLDVYGLYMSKIPVKIVKYFQS